LGTLQVFENDERNLRTLRRTESFRHILRENRQAEQNQTSENQARQNEGRQK
jgi:hypothetical protein